MSGYNKIGIYGLWIQHQQLQVTKNGMSKKYKINKISKWKYSVRWNKSSLAFQIFFNDDSLYAYEDEIAAYNIEYSVKSSRKIKIIQVEMNNFFLLHAGSLEGAKWWN